MSFIQREIDRLRAALLESNPATYDSLYAAQQALAWASEPDGFKSPTDLIQGTREDSEDCSARSCPPLSSDTSARCA